MELSDLDRVRVYCENRIKTLESFELENYVSEVMVYKQAMLEVLDLIVMIKKENE